MLTNTSLSDSGNLNFIQASLRKLNEWYRINGSINVVDLQQLLTDVESRLTTEENREAWANMQVGNLTVSNLTLDKATWQYCAPLQENPLNSRWVIATYGQSGLPYQWRPDINVAGPVYTQEPWQNVPAGQEIDVAGVLQGTTGQSGTDGGPSILLVSCGAPRREFQAIILWAHPTIFCIYSQNEQYRPFTGIGTWDNNGSEIPQLFLRIDPQYAAAFPGDDIPLQTFIINGILHQPYIIQVPDDYEWQSAITDEAGIVETGTHFFNHLKADIADINQANINNATIKNMIVDRYTFTPKTFDFGAALNNSSRYSGDIGWYNITETINGFDIKSSGYKIFNWYLESQITFNSTTETYEPNAGAVPTQSWLIDRAIDSTIYLDGGSGIVTQYYDQSYNVAVPSHLEIIIIGNNDDITVTAASAPTAPYTWSEGLFADETPAWFNQLNATTANIHEANIDIANLASFQIVPQKYDIGSSLTNGIGSTPNWFSFDTLNAYSNSISSTIIVDAYAASDVTWDGSKYIVNAGAHASQSFMLLQNNIGPLLMLNNTSSNLIDAQDISAYNYIHFANDCHLEISLLGAINEVKFIEQTTYTPVNSRAMTVGSNFAAINIINGSVTNNLSIIPSASFVSNSLNNRFIAAAQVQGTGSGTTTSSSLATLRTGQSVNLVNFTPTAPTVTGSVIFYTDQKNVFFTLNWSPTEITVSNPGGSTWTIWDGSTWTTTSISIADLITHSILPSTVTQTIFYSTTGTMLDTPTVWTVLQGAAGTALLEVDVGHINKLFADLLGVEQINIDNGTFNHITLIDDSAVPTRPNRDYTSNIANTIYADRAAGLIGWTNASIVTEPGVIINVPYASITVPGIATVSATTVPNLKTLYVINSDNKQTFVGNVLSFSATQVTAIFAKIQDIFIWDISTNYESGVLVIYEDPDDFNAIYTTLSKVPAGTPISNVSYYKRIVLNTAKSPTLLSAANPQTFQIGRIDLIAGGSGFTQGQVVSVTSGGENVSLTASLVTVGGEMTAISYDSSTVYATNPAGSTITFDSGNPSYVTLENVEIGDYIRVPGFNFPGGTFPTDSNTYQIQGIGETTNDPYSLTWSGLQLIWTTSGGSTTIFDGTTWLLTNVPPIGEDIRVTSNNFVALGIGSANVISKAIVDITTFYSAGTTLTNGHLEYVPTNDPVTQRSAVQNMINQQLAKMISITFIGIVSPTPPAVPQFPNIRVGTLWYQSSNIVLDTTFPWTVYTWEGTAWSTTTSSYTPNDFDTWFNANIATNGEEMWYWNLLNWVQLSFGIDLSNYVTISYAETITGQKTFTQDPLMPSHAGRPSTDPTAAAPMRPATIKELYDLSADIGPMPLAIAKGGTGRIDGNVWTRTSPGLVTPPTGTLTSKLLYEDGSWSSLKADNNSLRINTTTGLPLVSYESGFLTAETYDCTNGENLLSVLNNLSLDPRPINKPITWKFSVYADSTTLGIPPMAVADTLFVEWQLSSNGFDGNIFMSTRNGKRYYMNSTTGSAGAVTLGQWKLVGSTISTSRVVIGTTSSGDTLDNCNFLCTGTNDNLVIQQAVNSISTAQRCDIVFLGGYYYLSGSVNFGTLQGKMSTMGRVIFNISNFTGGANADVFSFNNNFEITGFNFSCYRSGTTIYEGRSILNCQGNEYNYKIRDNNFDLWHEVGNYQQACIRPPFGNAGNNNYNITSVMYIQNNVFRIYSNGSEGGSGASARSTILYYGSESLNGDWQIASIYFQNNMVQYSSSIYGSGNIDRNKVLFFKGPDSSVASSNLAAFVDNNVFYVVKNNNTTSENFQGTVISCFWRTTNINNNRFTGSLFRTIELRNLTSAGNFVINRMKVLNNSFYGSTSSTDYSRIIECNYLRHMDIKDNFVSISNSFNINFYFINIINGYVDLSTVTGNQVYFNNTAAASGKLQSFCVVESAAISTSPMTKLIFSENSFFVTRQEAISTSNVNFIYLLAANGLSSCNIINNIYSANAGFINNNGTNVAGTPTSATTFLTTNVHGFNNNL